MLSRTICALLLMGVTASSAIAAPNIVFIMADDLGWADVSTGLTNFGDPSDFYETPTIERLASEGMAFTNAYANQNCAPTRTAILSGAYAPRSTNNVYQVGDLNRWGDNNTLLVGPAQGLAGGDDALPTSTITHAETLKTAGYATAYVGKFHVTDNAGNITAAHGFDQNFGGGTAGGPGNYHASGGVFGGSITSGLDPYAANYTQQYVDDNIKPFNNGASTAAIDALVGTAKHVTDASADAAIDFMDANKSGNFFVQYSAHAVHTPIGNTQTRDDLLAKYQAKTPGAEDSNASFGALIEGLDQSVARIIDYLETTPDPNNPGKNLDENTIVVFYSDNGGRQNQSNNSVLKGQKGELDEGGIRVPMVAWSANAALVDGGTINHTPVMPIDFYKTFADYAGATLPGGQTLDGENLTSVISDVNHDLGRDNLYWHLPGYLQEGRNQKPQSVIRSGDWKLLYNYETQTYELYNLATDLDESDNVAEANDAVVDTLSTDLLNWLDDVDAPLATLRNGSLDLFITGTAYANGTTTNYAFETVTINAGEEVPFIVDTSPLDADTNMDGNVDVLDWIDFKAGFGTDMSGLTLLQSFQVGDIDHDLDNDINDFIAFKTSYDAVNGAGAFEAIVNVPEPGTLALLGAGGVLLLARRRRQVKPAAMVALLAVGGLFVVGSPAMATTYTWDGGTGTWEGSNWNGGNTANESDGNPPSASSYDYINDDFIIGAGGDVSSSQRVTLRAGSIGVTDATLTIDATGNFSAMNLGFGGGPTTATFTGSTVNLIGSGNAGRTMRLENGSSLTIDNTLLSMTNTGNNNFLEIESGNGVSMVNNATLNVGVIRLDGNVSNTSFTLDSGDVTLSGYTNALRSSTGFSGAFNWTGGAGDGSLTQVNNSVTGDSLAFKTTQGFFAIDGTRVNPTLAFDGTNLAAVNAELQSLAVNNKYLSITTGSGTSQTMQLLELLSTTLVLEVNELTGQATLLNEEAEAVGLGFYEVTSASDSLVSGLWNSLEDQDLPAFPAGNNDGSGWEELGTPSSGQLAEAYLLGDSSLASGGKVELGHFFNPAGTKDVAMRFVRSDDTVVDATVRYVTTGDFDSDSDVDAADIDALFAEDGNGVPPTDDKFDLIADGLINADPNTADSDIDQLVKVILGTEYADANLDRKVSLIDLNALGAGFGNPGGWAQGDFNGDGQVTLADLNVLGRNFGFDNSAPAAPGNPASPSAPVVPEPTSLALLALGGLALVRRRR